MTALRRIIAGLGYLPGYGNHPGVPVFALLVACAFLSGWLKISLACGAVGAALMMAVFGPMLFWGAYERARDYERDLKA